MAGLTILSGVIGSGSAVSAGARADVLEITDGSHNAGEIDALRHSTGCKLLLRLDPESRRVAATVRDPDAGIRARCRRLAALLPFFDYIELDSTRDLGSAVLRVVPPHKRLITDRSVQAAAELSRRVPESTGPANEENTCVEALLRAYRKISRIDAAIYRFIAPDGITALEFLDALRRHKIDARKVVAYAEDAEEVWSRIAASCLGARVIFTDCVGHDPIALELLFRQLSLSGSPRIEYLYGILGVSAASSLSPAMHTAALARLGRPALYLPFPDRSLEGFPHFASRLARIGLPLKGLSVNSPLKEAASERFPGARGIVDDARSANVLRLDSKSADTTDDIGLLQILRDYAINVAGRRVAVTGCGGSGRVAARLLIELGAHVAIFNRGRWRAELATRLLGLPCRPLGEFKPGDFDIVINAIPFPVAPDAASPFSIRGLLPGSILIDYGYSIVPNVLVAEARRLGATVIDGLVMLEKQVCAQFEILTGEAMPAGIVGEILRDHKTMSTTKAHSADPPGWDAAPAPATAREFPLSKLASNS